MIETTKIPSNVRVYSGRKCFKRKAPKKLINQDIIERANKILAANKPKKSKSVLPDNSPNQSGGGLPDNK